MAFSVLLIAVFTYFLSLPDVCGLVTRYAFQDDIRQYGVSDYPHVLQRFRWRGVGYTLAADVIRALISVLIGGILLKRAGFPEVGKLLVLFFTLFYGLLGKALPMAPVRHPVQNLVYPALLLLFVDWKLFLVCVVLGLLALALTGSRSLMVLVASVALPLFSIIFGFWWLYVFFAMLCGICFAFTSLEEIREYFTQRKEKAERRARRSAEAAARKEQDSDR